MHVELYKQIPLTGTMPERWYDAVGACLWVRFIVDGTHEWAGVFGGASPKHDKAVLFGDGTAALVIAAGQGYIVDPRSGQLLHKTACDLLRDAVAVPTRAFVIAHDGVHLYALGRVGVLWQGECLALDNIRFGLATPEALHGETWWDHTGWRPFTLTFAGWHFEQPEASE